MELPLIDNYRELFLNDTPMIDMRAPVEFAQGAFPCATSLPLMSDEERAAVGTCYKEHGQQSAIELGHQLVSGKVLDQRMEGWAAFVEANPHGALYCFRGGLRSRLTQKYIFEQTGIAYPRVKGGYKALRRFLINELDSAAQQIQPIILSGRTGSGKTNLLQRIKQSVDLEGIYHHRGSAFGNRVIPQPSQIDVENSLAITLLKKLDQHTPCKVVMEDEGGNIGSRRLPESLITVMRQSPIVVLEVSADDRAEVVYEEYITRAQTEYQQVQGEEQGLQNWANNLRQSLERIQRRLGGVRYKTLKEIMDHALAAQNSEESHGYFIELIKVLLTDYYDPMYDYQLSKKTERILFRGADQEVLEYLREQGVA